MLTNGDSKNKAVSFNEPSNNLEQITRAGNGELSFFLIFQGGGVFFLHFSCTRFIKNNNNLIIDDELNNNILRNIQDFESFHTLGFGVSRKSCLKMRIQGEFVYFFLKIEFKI